MFDTTLSHSCLRVDESFCPTWSRPSPAAVQSQSNTQRLIVIIDWLLVLGAWVQAPHLAPPPGEKSSLCFPTFQSFIFTTPTPRDLSNSPLYLIYEICLNVVYAFSFKHKWVWCLELGRVEGPPHSKPLSSVFKNKQGRFTRDYLMQKYW